MDEGSDKRPSMTRKTKEASSANLEEQLKQEGVAQNVEMKVEEGNREKPTIEGLLEEIEALKATVEGQKEDIRKFQEKQMTFEELSEDNRALKVNVKELCTRIMRIEGGEVLARAASEPKFRLTKSEFAELSELLRADDEVKTAVEELKTSIGLVNNDVQKKIEMKVVTPLTHFGGLPEEVWEQILGELEDSKDVLNAFKAFPDLEGRVLKNKYWWLFDQVVPHLRPWIKNVELLSCRLVCKKWSHGVDNYLENRGRVTEPEHLVTGQVCHPEGSMARIGDSRIPEVSFWNSSRLTQFLRDVDKHPPARNPFLGRSVEFYFDIFEEELVYLDKAMEIFRKYGHHIWFLTMSLSERKTLFDVISLVPNLKRLKLTWWADEYLTEFPGDEGVFLPPLPQLESLDPEMVFIEDNMEYCAMPSNFMESFVTGYSAQIKRLCISPSEFQMEYCTNFPELRELRLFDGSWSSNMWVSPSDLADLLTCLAAPNLAKLYIDVALVGPNGRYYSSGDVVLTVTLTDILAWIKPFPNLQHIKLDPFFAKFRFEQVDGLSITERVPSIKSLSIISDDVLLLELECLRCFPFLEYVSIDSYKFNEIKTNNVYRWNIWEELPALKELNFRPRPSWQQLRGHYYNRTKYEWLKKQSDELERNVMRMICRMAPSGSSLECFLNETWENSRLKLKEVKK